MIKISGDKCYIQKTKIIKEVIGKVVEPEGFIYNKEIKSWGFLRFTKIAREKQLLSI